MADAKFSIGEVNITNYLRVIAREVANPLVEVYNQTFAAPHPSIRNFVVSGLNAKPHYFDFYETADVLNTGTLLSTFYIDVGLINQSTLELIEFVVGESGGPAHNDVEYVNTYLDGISTDKLQVMQRSVGVRSWTDEIELITGGGFKLLDGELFNNGDRWFLTIIKTITTTPPNASNSLFDDIKFISSNTTNITSNHYNNLLVMAGSSGWQNIIFPDLSTIPDNTRFSFNTLDGTAKGFIIEMGGTGQIQTNGGAETKFYLRRFETISFVSYQGLLIMYDGKGNWDKVGHQVIYDSDDATTIDATTAKEHGQWIDIDDEPRLFYWYVNKLPLNYLATDFVTAGESGKWAIDLPNNRFRMPDSRDKINGSAFSTRPGLLTTRTTNQQAPKDFFDTVISVFNNRIL